MVFINKTPDIRGEQRLVLKKIGIKRKFMPDGKPAWNPLVFNQVFDFDFRSLPTCTSGR
jgi:hypothetical protein